MDKRKILIFRKKVWFCSKKSDAIYARDDVDGLIYEGEVLDVDMTNHMAYVGYETDYYLKHRDVAFEDLEHYVVLMHETVDWFWKE